jgi:type IV secretory pathway TraG/TraD family ATPase VirD4
MQPALVQLLQQDCGGLIFDVKGDFKSAVYKLAEEHKREVITIGVHQRGVNLLKGLSPEMSASFLKSAFFLAGIGGADRFWIDTATELCKNSLGVLSFVPGAYSLEALYRYLFFETERDTLTAAANERLSELDQRQTRLLLSYMKYHEVVFSAFDDKVKQGVLATVAQVLSPFQHPDLVDAFCTDHEEAVNMESVLDGNIYLVDLPLATWGLGGKAVYTFIKLRFFNVLQARSTREDLNRERPVFFMCDEYQDVISANKAGLSDLNFWDKSRSAKCIGIISAQSISSFRSAVGDRTLADTVLQNFRQKVCFRTEDLETVNYINQLSGRVEVKRVSESHNVGTSSSSGSMGTHDQESFGTSAGWTERPAVDAQLIRQLGPDQAIVFFNIDGHAMDDVVWLRPVFVE